MEQPIVIMALRALHILSGVFWAGSISLLARYVVPSSRSRERDPGGVLGDMFKDRRLGMALGGAGIVNVVTGLLLYWRLFWGHAWNLRSPGPVEAFGVGGILAIVALILGAGYGASMFVALSHEQGGPESAAVAQRRAARVAILTRVLMVLLVLATLLMAIARYL
jgi:hypothetical protein